MQFTLSDEQEQIQTAAREFFESKDVLELARRQLEGDDQVVDDLWKELSAMDYTAITVPFEYDGLGEDILYSLVVLEEAGRVAMPGPFPETVSFAVPLISELGTNDQKSEYFPDIIDGTRRLSVALYDDPVEPIPQSIEMEAQPADDGYRLKGTKTLVPYGGMVDQIVVPARLGDGQGYDGITLFIVDTDRLEIRRQDSLDKTRPYFDVTFDDVHVSETARLGPEDAGGDALERALDRLRVTLCAMMVGAMERVVELSVEQGNNREAFGHPVGRYQAVKHRTVDMWMDMQAGRSLVYYGAWAVANDEPDAKRAVSVAKAFCGNQFPGLCGDDIQNQGAMGITWDHDTHIYLKQAMAWKNFLGTPADHHQRIIAEHSL